MEFFGEGDGEGSGELELDWGGLDAEFFVEFAECGLRGSSPAWMWPAEEVSNLPGKESLFWERFWSKTWILLSFWRMIQMWAVR